MITDDEPAVVYLSLGSNIEPALNLIRALRILTLHCQIGLVSSAYITPPQGYHDQDDFWNIALKVTTDLTPISLKHRVLDVIEQELGRKRDPNNKNAPRTIDLDISLWNQDVFDYGDKPWHIPDPDVVRFAHVIVPLAEIAPDYVHPVEKVTLAQIAARFDKEQLGFRRQENWRDS